MKNKPFLYCNQIRAVATTLLVPDMDMGKLDTIKIPFSDITLDVPIGINNNVTYTVRIVTQESNRRGRGSASIQRNMDKTTTGRRRRKGWKTERGCSSEEIKGDNYCRRND